MIKWPTHIKVDKRIVRILSASTYDNFPSALKEIITNSYDADASNVTIQIDVKNQTILIEDDGYGMDELDFSQFLVIAGKKKNKAIKSPSGRYIIGQFGVGFLSIFPFFKNFTLESKISGSDEYLFAEIPCSQYFSSNAVDINQIQVHGGTKFYNGNPTKHFTKIKLSGFTELTKKFFNPRKKLSPRRNSILKESSIEILKWNLSENLPLSYKNKKLNLYFDTYSVNLPFNVSINGVALLRNSYGETILEMTKTKVHRIGKIKFKYFICTDRKAINNPIEGRYLKIRNLNVGIGDRTTFGLGTEVGGARSRLQWLSGEVHIIEGLNDIITVSRDKFNYDEDYEELKDFFIKKLSYYSTKLEKEDEIQNAMEASEQGIVKSLKMFDEISTDTYLALNSKKYKVVLDHWNQEDDIFPACKLVGGTIKINKSYTLFKNKRYLDVFLKFHILLLSELQKKVISQSNYSEITRDILQIFEDYRK